jgi:hypothetical protein
MPEPSAGRQGPCHCSSGSSCNSSRTAGRRLQPAVLVPCRVYTWPAAVDSSCCAHTMRGLHSRVCQQAPPDSGSCRPAVGQWAPCRPLGLPVVLPTHPLHPLQTTTLIVQTHASPPPCPVLQPQPDPHPSLLRINCSSMGGCAGGQGPRGQHSGMPQIRCRPPVCVYASCKEGGGEARSRPPVTVLLQYCCDSSIAAMVSLGQGKGL